LGPDGRFVASRLGPTSVEGVTASDAEDLAFRHLRWQGRGYESYFSEQHGRAVRSDRLRICRVTMFAEPSITVSDTSGLPRLIRESIEGAYLVSLCQENDPFVAVLYAVTPSAVSYRFGDRVDSPPDGGRAIFPVAIPRGREPYPSPEQSVLEVWQASGARVAGVPRLVLPHPRFSPEYVRWEAPLERTVQGLAANRPVDASVLSFGYVMDGLNPPYAVLGIVPDTIPEFLRELAFTDANNATRRWVVEPRPGHGIWYAPFRQVGRR
jgi:hypothetical protein